MLTEPSKTAISSHCNSKGAPLSASGASILHSGAVEPECSPKMRLTNILFKYRPEFIGYIPKYRGAVYFGKHRFVPPVTGMHKYFMLRQILNEEKNMRILNQPFITDDQEAAYLRSIDRSQPEYKDEHIFKKIQTPPSQRYTVDLLKKLDEKSKFFFYD